MEITVSIKVTAQRASKEICDKLRKPYGTIEVLSEGYRIAWAKNDEEAIQAAIGLIGSDLTATATTEET